MTTLATLALYALVASIVVAVVYAAKSVRLQNRFRQLGPLNGRSVQEILGIAGEPSHRTRLDAHREVLEWRRVGFHIALTFTDGVCDGVMHVDGGRP